MNLSRVPQKLKVVHIASGDRWAGAEVQLYTLLTQLNKNDDSEPSAILLNDGELAQRLRAQHIHVDVIDESQHSTLTIFCKLIKLLREHSPDIVHTHRQKENILGAIASALSIRARSVRTVHGANEQAPLRASHRLIRALDRWVGNCLQQRVIAVSDDLALKLRSDFLAKIVVIENGVDINAVRSAVKPVDFRLAAPNKVHIGIIGRLDPVKRIDIFLSMAQLLLSEQPATPWHFHIFGEGALDHSLKTLASQLGINNAATFHGHRRDSAACLAGLDAVIMCSDHEGLPMTVLEALAVGTPILAHAVGGLNAVLADDAGGRLVAEHAPRGYSNALIQLLQQDKARFKAAGLTRVRQHYSAEINATQIAELYRTLLPLSRLKNSTLTKR